MESGGFAIGAVAPSIAELRPAGVRDRAGHAIIVINGDDRIVTVNGRERGACFTLHLPIAEARA